MILETHYCDKCKVEIKNMSAAALVKLNIGFNCVREGELVRVEVKDLELCKACQAELLEWLTGRKVTTREDGSLFLS